MEQKKLSVDKWMVKHFLTRVATSHVCIAFFYGVFLFLYEIKFLREIVPSIHPFLIAWAGFLIVYDVIIRDYWKKIPYYSWLMLFSLITLITAVVTREAGLISNIKACILIAIPLFVFFPVCMQKSKDKALKDFIKVLYGASIVIFLASSISLMLYLVRFSQNVTFMGITTLVGYGYYFPNDPTSALILYGVYTDTNHAASYALVFAIYSIVLFVSCNKGLFKSRIVLHTTRIFAVLNFFVQMAFFPLANSRGGWLCFLLATMIICFLYVFNTKNIEKGYFVRGIISISVSVICTVIVMSGVVGMRRIMSSSSTWVSQAVAEMKNHDEENAEEQQESIEEQQESIEEQQGNKQENEEMYLESEEGTQEKVEDNFKKDDGDYEGGERLVIWKDVMALFKKNPVLGIGTGNTQYYAAKYHMENTTIGTGQAVHNSYLDLLLDYGIIGFIILMIFYVRCAVKSMKYVFNKKNKKDIIYFLVLWMVIIVAGSSAFLSCVFINTTAMYYLLLITLGYLMGYLHENKEI